MGYNRLLEAIGDRAVIIDECLNTSGYWGLNGFLQNKGIQVRCFPQGTKDEVIIGLCRPNEVVITLDRKLAKRLGENAIRLPFGKPNKTYKEWASRIDMQTKLEIDEFLRDYEQTNKLQFNIMRGMRMLFCAKVDDVRGKVEGGRWQPI